MPAQDTLHFKVHELLCPHCGEGADMLKQELLDALERVRDVYGKPMPVNSGYRCAEHNAAIGGAQFSAHKEGKAADIADLDGELKSILIAPTCERLGIWIEHPMATKGWVHITVRPAPSRIFWP